MWGLIGYWANIDKNAQTRLKTVLINDYAIIILVGQAMQDRESGRPNYVLF